MGRGLLLLMMIGALAAAAGCARIANWRGAKPLDSLPYRASARAEGKDRRALTVTVRVPEGVGLDRLRESVRFPVTAYCIRRTGFSDAEWEIDPATGDWAYRRVGDRLVFHARCAK